MPIFSHGTSKEEPSSIGASVYRCVELGKLRSPTSTQATHRSRPMTALSGSASPPVPVDVLV